MQIKIDECLPGEIAELLSGIGHIVETVKDEDLTGCPDHILWDLAQKEKRCFWEQVNFYFPTLSIWYGEVLPGT
jgi:predicted nuclease of predicted toxin-antitoxin system